MKLSETELQSCCRILRESGSIDAAIKRVREEVANAITYDSLQKQFKRRELGTLTSYVGRKVVPERAPSVPVIGGASVFEPETERWATPKRKTTRILVCPDAHHPYAHDLAWRTFGAVAKAWEPDILIIIGDFADCMSVSFHPKDPSRKLSLKDEIDQVNTALDELSRLQIPRVEFLCGNHELRLQRWLWDRAPELYGLIEISELLRIKQRGWGWTPYRESLQVGRIHFSHDVGRCGKYTASQSLADYGHSIVIGHSHRAATFYGGTVHGDRQVAMNVGTLIDIETVDYRHRAMATREWQHGFGVIHMTEDGVGWCTFCPIIEGRAVVDGMVISGRAAG